VFFTLLDGAGAPAPFAHGRLSRKPRQLGHPCTHVPAIFISAGRVTQVSRSLKSWGAPCLAVFETWGFTRYLTNRTSNQPWCNYTELPHFSKTARIGAPPVVVHVGNIFGGKKWPPAHQPSVKAENPRQNQKQNSCWDAASAELCPLGVRADASEAQGPSVARFQRATSG
jgi:hypothetical protein